MDLMVLSDYMIPKLRARTTTSRNSTWRTSRTTGNCCRTILNDPIDPGAQASPSRGPTATPPSPTTRNRRSTPVTSIKELFTPRPQRQGLAVREMEDTIAFALLALGKNPPNFTDADFNAALDYVAAAKDTRPGPPFTGNDYLSDFSQGNTARHHGLLRRRRAARQANLSPSTCPRRGCSSWSDNMCIPNFARHKTNAEKLMNYYLPADSRGRAGRLHRLHPGGRRRGRGAQDAGRRRRRPTR